MKKEKFSLLTEDESLMKILYFIENEDQFSEVKFRIMPGDDGHVKITAIDKHGSEYKFERIMG